MTTKKVCVVDGCQLPSRSRGWCEKHYARWRRNGHPAAKVAPKPRRLEPVADRFWSKVDRTGGPDACWPWVAGKSDGYGRFAVESGTVRRAHRVAWFLTYGAWPEQHIDHTCHNGAGCALAEQCPHRACVNPAHLEDVSQRENTLRGNTRPGINARKTHCPRGHPLSGVNLLAYPGAGRLCRICNRDSTRRSRARRLERERAAT